MNESETADLRRIDHQAARDAVLKVAQEWVESRDDPGAVKAGICEAARILLKHYAVALVLLGGLLVNPWVDQNPWQGTLIAPDQDGPEVLAPVPPSGTSIERFPNYMGGESVTRPSRGDRIDCYPSVLGGTKCIVQ